MKVFVVTSGEYSAYHIDAIFTDGVIARQYANLDCDRNVEEYETDIESVEYDPNKLIYSVSYNIEKDVIEHLYLTSINNVDEDKINDITLVDFRFNVGQSESLDWSIRMFGMGSDLLKKIAQDRFYMYCDAHDTSRKILLQKKKERNEQFNKRYGLYKTSADTGIDFTKYINANTQCKSILDDMIANGIELPNSEQLRKTYNDILMNIEKEKTDEQDQLY